MLLMRTERGQYLAFSGFGSLFSFTQYFQHTLLSDCSEDDYTVCFPSGDTTRADKKRNFDFLMKL